MRFDNLIIWLKNPDLLDRDSLPQLKALVDEYPCFAVARILYQKNLLVLKDLRFSKELIRTAISIPDRKRLYYFMEDKPMPESPYSHEKELSSGEGFSIIDRFLHLSESGNAAAEMAENPAQSGSIQKELSPLPEAVDVNLGDTFDLPQEESSFSLDYVSYLNQTSSTLEGPCASMPGQELIDAFLNTPSELKKTPIMQNEVQETQPMESVNKGELKTESEENTSIENLPEDTFTETLAKIYLKQKRYDRALEIFKSLSLKYPEKNVYFADQIRFLEKLIINIKNN